jgi:hypothetical protein
MESRGFRVRKMLSADGLFGMLRKRFDSVSDPRPGSPTIPLGDAPMAAFAMFSLKCPSLLAFDRVRSTETSPVGTKNGPNCSRVIGWQRSRKSAERRFACAFALAAG